MSTATICKPVADTIDTSRIALSRAINGSRRRIAILAEEKEQLTPPPATH